MKIRALVSAVFAGALLLAVAPCLEAQITTYTWNGADGTTDFFDSDDWSGFLTPPNPIDAPSIATALANSRVVFGDVGVTSINYDEIYVNQLAFIGNQRGYTLQGYSDTTHIGNGGIVYSPGAAVTSAIYGPIQLEASQTWNVASGTLLLGNDISDTTYVYDGEIYVSTPHSYQVTKTGSGTLVLGEYDNSDWSGGLKLSGGKVVIYSAYDSTNVPLGSGTLTFDGGTLVAKPYAYEPGDSLYLDNNVVSNGLISTANGVDLHLGYNDGEVSSQIILAADTTVQATGRPLFLDGDIGETGGARKLTINSSTPVILTGSSSYTGGTNVTHGALIFGSLDSIPSYNLDSGSVGHLTAAANAYIGYGDDNNTSGTQANFINDFDKSNTHGTIGFDTDPNLGYANIFTDGVDLTGFNADVRLGSATRAILGYSATITPQGGANGDYLFGGGGGWLQVDSALTGTGALNVSSPAAWPLTLRLTNGTNSWSGGTTVTNSGVIFGTDGDGGGSSFSGANHSVAIGTGGYVGFEDPGYDGVTVSDMVAGMLDTVSLSSTGMVGFDVEPGYGQSFSSGTVINLGSFTGNLYFGTASRYTNDGEQAGLSIAGPFTTTNGGTDPYRFAGYKGGWLDVQTSLTGTAGVKIGDPTSPGTFGDPINSQYSIVELTGDNSALSGNVTLYGGELLVGQGAGVTGTNASTALGTGTLIVAGMTLPTDWQDADGVTPSPQLAANTYGLIIGNNIQLNTRLNIGGDYDFALAGVISGPGSLYMADDTYLTLSGNNTFSGGVYLSGESTLELNHDNASGTGPLSFGRSADAEVYFDTANPVIGGLVSKEPSDYAYLYTEQPNTVLTINQSSDSSFNGEIEADEGSETLRLVKTGTGTLQLNDFEYYSNGTTEAALGGAAVGLQINQGTVMLGQNAYISDQSTVWVHGGTLALDSAELYNSVVVDNGGKLAGNGYFNPSNSTGIVIGTGATLSPGFSGSTGILGFSHLELNSGGTYVWKVKSTDASDYGGHDYIYVSDEGEGTEPLVLNATTADRFTLKVISLTLAGSAGLLNGFDPNVGYSWDIIGFDVLQGGFDPAKFAIDTTGFANSLTGAGGNGIFSLTLVDNQIMLNFTPVPEPSTYALIGLGLCLSGIAAWRKRRPVRRSLGEDGSA